MSAIFISLLLLTFPTALEMRFIASELSFLASFDLARMTTTRAAPIPGMNINKSAGERKRL